MTKLTLGSLTKELKKVNKVRNKLRTECLKTFKGLKIYLKNEIR